MHRTVVVNLEPTVAQANTLSETARLFTSVFNYICAGAWANREKNGVRLHHDFYYPLRAKFPDLVSDLHIQARVKATESVRSALALAKTGRKVSCPSSDSCPPRYNIHTFRVDWESRTIRLSTVSGRQTLRFRIAPHAEKHAGSEIDTADLICRDGRWFMHISVTLPEPQIPTSNCVLGVDLGVSVPAVTSDNQFLGKRRWKDIEGRRFKLKRRLQSKGTKSSKRHLKKIRRSEARFRRDCDHVLSRRIVQSAAPGGTIAVENLTDIRKRITAKKKTATKRRIHSWSFAQLRGFIEYKAEERGCTVVAVDPRYTSQRCSGCGYTARNNRRSRSHFVCRQCGLELHADLNAARNIAAKYRAQTGISDLGGQPVNLPIVGDAEFVRHATHNPPALAGGS